MSDSKAGKLCELLQIEHPIIQAGMVWVSGAKLAAASAEAGALGVIGAGSMKPELLKSQIRKARSITSKPVGINVPLLYSKTPEQIQTALSEGIKVFITSAGSPKKFTRDLKDAGCIVIHVVSTPELAHKCELANVDAVVAEGFEAGGHNGRDELTTMVLIPQTVDKVQIPVIAAGGIADGRGIAAAFALGASGVQIGSRFAATIESRAHANFKNAITAAGCGDTRLMMKKLVPVRLLRNKFFDQVEALEKICAPAEELQHLLGKGRAQAGMHDGDLETGELEIGQVSGMINDIPSVETLVTRLKTEYINATSQIPNHL